jgi:hypothetical protein
LTREPVDLIDFLAATHGGDQPGGRERKRRNHGGSDEDSLGGPIDADGPQAPELDSLSQPSAEQRPDLSREALRLGKVERKVAQELTIGRPPGARVRQEA